MLQKKCILIVGDYNSPLLKGLTKRLSEEYSLKFINPYSFKNYYELKRNVIEVITSVDFIHFHYLSLRSLRLLCQLDFDPNIKIIVSLWGSDMYHDQVKLKGRIYKFIHMLSIKKIKEKLQRVDKWTVANPKLFTTIRPIFNFEIPPQKKHIALFGSELDKADFNSYCLSESELIKITIGYNARRLQQHIRVLSELKHLPDVLRKRIHIILPFNYGGSQSYKSRVLRKMLSLGISFEVINRFLNKEELTDLRLRSDIFIQVQTSDQFSTSMLEYIFAGNLVITGAWLDYQEMRKKGVQFKQIEKMTDLSGVLVEVIKSYKRNSDDIRKNKQLAFELIDWGNNLPMWTKLYTT